VQRIAGNQWVLAAVDITQSGRGAKVFSPAKVSTEFRNRQDVGEVW